MKQKPQNSSLETYRHSTSHILAHAVKELYPGVKFGIGPAIEEGFYYDFDLSHRFVPEDLATIEKKMQEIIKKDYPFIRKEVAKEEAIKIFKAKGEKYKVELLKEIKDKEVSLYESGGFVDLCKGPHVESTGKIKSFKLLRISGAYWRGSEKNPMLQRIYGTAFYKDEELKDYLEKLEEAKKRDHRKIGKELDLFIFSDLVGKGLPLFTEKGSIIRRELENFIVEEEIKRGYKHVYTPDIARVELYKTSGHYPYYKDSMYPVMKIDEEELILRPMTCPHHFQLYSYKPRTYKELPIRIAELAKQFRYEKSGELTGLIRARLFCLADAHIICQKEKAVEEINNILDLIEFVAATLGLKKGESFRYRLSLGDREDSKKYYKDDKSWDFAEKVLRSVLEKRKSPFFEAKKEAAFYGPKIDIQMKNFLGKEETAFTVQYDFVMPKRFNLSYIDRDGGKKEPIVIHRSSVGAIERTLAFLLEHHAGALPVWLSPIQVRILPISEDNLSYAEGVYSQIKSAGIRVELNSKNETLSYKIRGAEQEKIPYIVVVGKNEEKEKTLSVRKRKEGDQGKIGINEFIDKLKKEIENKK